MNIGAAFPGKYIKAAELGAARPVVTIDYVVIEAVGGDDEQKPVVHFQGKSKGLVLNVTNANMITEICGTPETDNWKGKRILLYATKTEFGGKRVDCIRVDYPPTGAAAPAPPPPPADEWQADDSDVPFSLLLPFILPAIISLGALA
jgi:hypothetical protein